MSKTTSERKLAAILHADVVGYSRLMDEDESGTHRILRTYLDVISALITEHQGRVVNYAGDAVLADFTTASAAVNCAVAIQHDLNARNQALPDERKVEFRIGINLGEVIVDRDEIYGSGVNLAARLESAAHPGGICISSALYDQIKGKTDAVFADGGLKELKNIAQATRVYHWQKNANSEKELTAIENSVVDKPDPTIAVLPFDNMSGDPDQSYFSDGITEDIITDLSKVSSLFVVARNSSFTYKGCSVKIEEICADLGVRYVVEGSVRKSGNKVRITAQLIDGVSGGHLWADRYDGTLEDVFELQDKVTYQIVDALKIRLLPEEKQAMQKVSAANIEAYDYYLKGRQCFHYFDKENLYKARDYFTRAIACDENYAQAYCGLADCGSFLRWHHDGDHMELVNAIAASAKAVALAPELAEGHASLGLALLVTGEFSGAEKEFLVAVKLNQNLYEAHFYWGRACFSEGKLEQAAEHLEMAWKHSPKDAQTPGLLLQIYRSLGRQVELEHTARETVRIGLQKMEVEPDNTRNYLSLAFGFLNLGQFSEASELLERALSSNPNDAIINYNVACLYSGMDNLEKAIHHLEISLQQGTGRKQFVGWLENDSDLDPIRNHPKFKALLETYVK